MLFVCFLRGGGGGVPILFGMVKRKARGKPLFVGGVDPQIELGEGAIWTPGDLHAWLPKTRTMELGQWNWGTPSLPSEADGFCLVDIVRQHGPAKSFCLCCTGCTNISVYLTRCWFEHWTLSH